MNVQAASDRPQPAEGLSPDCGALSVDDHFARWRVCLQEIRHLLSAGRGGQTGLQCGDARGDFLVNPL